MKYAAARRLLALVTGFHRDTVPAWVCPAHERVESARPLQHPQGTDTRHLRYDGQQANF